MTRPRTSHLYYLNLLSHQEDTLVFLPGEGGTEEIGNMIQSYIKEIEDLR